MHALWCHICFKVGLSTVQALSISPTEKSSGFLHWLCGKGLLRRMKSLSRWPAAHTQTYKDDPNTEFSDACFLWPGCGIHRKLWETPGGWRGRQVKGGWRGEASLARTPQTCSFHPIRHIQKPESSGTVEGQTAIRGSDAEWTRQGQEVTSRTGRRSGLTAEEKWSWHWVPPPERTPTTAFVASEV